jgi:serine/threonine protein kinase
MPPEVMVADPKYDTSVDEFSYGIMMIHMFSGRWPEPQVGPNRTEPNGRLIPVTEAERREVFLRAIGNDHPLMDLILKCIHNHPQARAHASEIVGRLAEMVLQFPASFANRLEMLRRIEADGEEKRALTEQITQTRDYLATKQQVSILIHA